MDGDNDKFDYELDKERECRILPGQTRREMAAWPRRGEKVTAADNAQMTRNGFDKDLKLTYYFKLACENCHACTPARIIAADYVLNKHERKIIHRNADLVVTVNDKPSVSEHEKLFLQNFNDRHKDSYSTFQQMVIQHTPDMARMLKHRMFPNLVLEVREKSGAPQRPGRLVGAALFDDCADGFKGHYYYYEPGLPAARSMGTFMILQLIAMTQEAGKRYLYTGPLTREPSKISYKTRFQPMETLGPGGWQPFRP
jgi:arginine-tRNA-protein transferase